MQLKFLLKTSCFSPSFYSPLGLLFYIKTLSICKHVFKDPFPVNNSSSICTILPFVNNTTNDNCTQQHLATLAKTVFVLVHCFSARCCCIVFLLCCCLGFCVCCKCLKEIRQQPSFWLLRFIVCFFVIFASQSLCPTVCLPDCLSSIVFMFARNECEYFCITLPARSSANGFHSHAHIRNNVVNSFIIDCQNIINCRLFCLLFNMLVDGRLVLKCFQVAF